MKRLGAHVSASGGVSNAPLNAMKIGADAFALFVKNQRQWSAKAIEPKEIEEFKANLKTANIRPEHILPHNSYLVNLGHPDTLQRQKSIDAFLDEIQRCEMLGLKMINFHPGSHLKAISTEECLANISDSMNYLLQNSNHIKLVIENTAGQGSNLGFKFEHLGYLVQNSIDKSRVGVCIDTCHLFSAGYDIRDAKSYEKTTSQFDKIVGFEYLSGMHLNDTKFNLGSKKDRHESLGKGYLGWSSFENIMNDSRIDEIPLILETIDDSLWSEEIAQLRNLIKGK
ncbi:endonuclease IV [Campylobacter iguaniorum]|uniref:Probable endonuclease 4 n=1 Tax=Campylobacter iguaniorum TaxID=1244531 RepID=A0A076FAY5_9BACT|nr:deoxyribonuclease IV [Campylobacter iguaniorum]AII15390.1 endonuclease IV [Campylobacter iguaniorum]